MCRSKYLVIACLPALLFLSILSITGYTLAQSDEKTFTNTKFGLSTKYPSDWTFIIQEEDLSSQLYDDSMVLPAGVTNIGDFCPSSEIEDDPELFDCQIKSAAHFGITAYKLKPGTNLKELSNQESPDNVFLTTNLGTFNIEISGIPAIQEVHTVRPNPAHSDIDTLFNEVGRGETKEMNTYLVNGNFGYLLHAEADNKESYDKYLPTFEKMIKSFHIQGTKAIQNNTVLVPDANNASPDDVVMLSQKLKKGSGGYNDIIGQVKNIGSDTVEFVKIGLTVYDKNGDVVGTDSTYAEATTLEPSQKSSFDIISTKDNFDEMQSYELSLQWRDSDGTDQYVDNAQIYK